MDEVIQWDLEESLLQSESLLSNPTEIPFFYNVLPLGKTLRKIIKVERDFRVISCNHRIYHPNWDIFESEMGQN